MTEPRMYQLVLPAGKISDRIRDGTCAVTIGPQTVVRRLPHHSPLPGRPGVSEYPLGRSKLIKSKSVSNIAG